MQLPGDFRSRLNSTLDPKTLSPLLGTAIGEWLKQFEFTDSPDIHVEARGSQPDAGKLWANGVLRLGTFAPAFVTAPVPSLLRPLPRRAPAAAATRLHLGLRSPPGRVVARLVARFRYPARSPAHCRFLARSPLRTPGLIAAPVRPSLVRAGTICMGSQRLGEPLENTDKAVVRPHGGMPVCHHVVRAG